MYSGLSGGYQPDPRFGSAMSGLTEISATWPMFAVDTGGTMALPIREHHGGPMTSESPDTPTSEAWPENRHG